MENKEIRKLTRVGERSIGLTLPIDEARNLGWRERQKVKATGGSPERCRRITRIKGGLLIRDFRS